MQEHGGSIVRVLAGVSVALGVLLAPGGASAQSLIDSPTAASEAAETSGSSLDNPLGIPDLRSVAPAATSRQGISATLQIFIVLTVLSLAPAILAMTTCFTRIVIVLSLLRQAMATQGLPPGQVVAGLSLFMTFVVMGPTWQRIHTDAVKPWLDNEPGMTQQKACDIAVGHMREFMFTQIEHAGNEETVYLFYEHSAGASVPLDSTLTRSDVPTMSLIPAFILSELKTAFVMGFRVYLPFLVIDMVLASVLVSMGMMMLPPMLISLPFKLLLFVLADGWQLVVGSLMSSFG
ncbi:MAG: flagellar type III secretion system pore protein FliP [Phycisphaerae bacterium]|nr:flagellar type III secretion system pore protein FliP [Phycisphaerae bacterium]